MACGAVRGATSATSTSSTNGMRSQDRRPYGGFTDAVIGPGSTRVTVNVTAPVAACEMPETTLGSSPN